MVHRFMVIDESGEDIFPEPEVNDDVYVNIPPNNPTYVSPPNQPVDVPRTSAVTDAPAIKGSPMVASPSPEIVRTDQAIIKSPTS